MSEKCMLCGYDLDAVKNAKEGLKLANKFRVQSIKQIRTFLQEKGLYEEYCKWCEEYLKK